MLQKVETSNEVEPVLVGGHACSAVVESPVGSSPAQVRSQSRTSLGVARGIFLRVVPELGCACVGRVSADVNSGWHVFRLLSSPPAFERAVGDGVQLSSYITGQWSRQL